MTSLEKQGGSTQTLPGRVVFTQVTGMADLGSQHTALELADGEEEAPGGP